MYDTDWLTPPPPNDVDSIHSYKEGSSEREKLLDAINYIKENPVEIPLIIDGKRVDTDETLEITCPHEHKQLLATAHLAGPEEIMASIDASLKAWKSWSKTEWYTRSTVFRKAAAELAGPSRTMNIATIMLNHSKNPYEAEIDLAELVDFWNLNTYYCNNIYKHQPMQIPDEQNTIDWRPLEGFILAIPPFNFYSIGGNLPSAPAIMGNTVIWKPSSNVILSNFMIMKNLLDSGLPDGVINFVPFRSKHANILLKHRDLAGVHFTGSSFTLKKIYGIIGANLDKYKNYPRIVGEAGGKDFIFVHRSANLENVAINIIRGAYGYQGQKCSAASRLYVPESLWDPFRIKLTALLSELKMGKTEDLGNFMGAVIDNSSYLNIIEYLQEAKEEEYTIIYGGESYSENGWFIEPTLIESRNPKSRLMEEEIFGPVLTVYVYPDDEYHETLKLCDDTSPYALTGSIFAQERNAIEIAKEVLRYSAGNFYINDKPTGAIVGRQPFGGARASGTNDKAGSFLNLLCWLSPRTIKETLVYPDDWRYGFQM
jgi:1-pyrroline-5-carboxylate dehydrogenase